MNDFSELKRDMQVIGLLPDGKPVWIAATIAISDDAWQVIYKNEAGKIAEQMVYREQLAKLRVAETNLAGSFDAPADDFKLALEATRIKLGSLFDPMMAVHSSNIEPLPHQISAVYESMLPKQPLRFVLADDPGAGKTIMAGLLIKELIMRADARRILIVSPGSLTEQWQDELLEKFALEFKIFSNELQNLSASGNYFNDADLLIVRVDQIARNEDYRRKLSSTQWDLIIVDEAHKMAAHLSGREVKKTQRYQLGELLSSITRHFLLMTATPHSGSDADFNLWLSLIDPDRFYGAVPDGNGYQIDVSDVMRRMVKEKLLRFDGTRLFPERRALTISYNLSVEERALYEKVTEYVVKEMNRAQRIAREKGNQVGFALTVLQRRLASSPEAIYKSLDRRLARLEDELRQSRQRRAEAINGDTPAYMAGEDAFTYYRPVRVDAPTDWDDVEDEWTPEEYEQMMDNLISATTAQNIEELQKEINTLRSLKEQAKAILTSGHDCKWDKLSELLRTNEQIFDASGKRHKLIIFTEHKDTLEYLRQRISGLLGNADGVRTISGSNNRETRRQVQEDFCNDPNVHILIATDAAGEGVNLQRAHLLINYDLPWNPNRLEQRFGRIHRIGQTETCLMWNMVAAQTREGQVFDALFHKLETERNALGGQVFDILGEAFKERPLKELLLEAIRKEASEEARKWMTERVEHVLNHEALQAIMQRNMLVDQAMTKEALYAVKAELDKAEARKLQPYFVQAFFLSAFCDRSVGGSVLRREPGRFQIRNVPASLLELNRMVLQTRTPLTKGYERICFEKSLIRPDNSVPKADFLHPGHPLMQTLTEKILREYGELIKTGAVMVDTHDDTTEPSLIAMVSHTIRESSGEDKVSERLQFVRIRPDGSMENAGWAPHLDLSAPEQEHADIIRAVREQPWLQQDWETKALRYATDVLAKDHYEEVSKRRAEQADKIQQAIRERLITAIYKLQEDALRYERQIARGGSQANAQPSNARKKAQELKERLALRERELDDMRHPLSNTPIILGAILVVPQGLINKESGSGTFCADASARRRIERLAMDKVMEIERAFGHEVTDVSADKLGWDITAQPPAQGDTLPDARHIEVKGRAKDADTVTITSNEVKTALNQQDKYILALVEVDGDTAGEPLYIRHPFRAELMDGQVSGNFSLQELRDRGVAPDQTLP